MSANNFQKEQHGFVFVSIKREQQTIRVVQPGAIYLAQAHVMQLAHLGPSKIPGYQRITNPIDLRFERAMVKVVYEHLLT